MRRNFIFAFTDVSVDQLSGATKIPCIKLLEFGVNLGDEDALMAEAPQSAMEAAKASEEIDEFHALCVTFTRVRAGDGNMMAHER